MGKWQGWRKPCDLCGERPQASHGETLCDRCLYRGFTSGGGGHPPPFDEREARILYYRDRASLGVPLFTRPDLLIVALAAHSTDAATLAGCAD